MKPYLLQDEELKELIAKIPEWEIKEKLIEREFNFTNFIDAFSFMTKVALVCEKFNQSSSYGMREAKHLTRSNTTTYTSFKSSSSFFLASSPVSSRNSK